MVSRRLAHGHLRRALSAAGARRLLAVRLAGQFGDGVFQASLAGAVLFDPERQARAADIAAAFAVVLLPYSFIGPFAGVLLDRWRRQRILVWANVLRAVAVGLVAAVLLSGGALARGPAFYASALLVLSASRFFLSALSASLPHVVAPDELVSVNAVVTTSGTIATTLGGGAAVLVRELIGGSDGSYAAIAVAAALPYLLSATIARRFGADALGPDEVERGNRETVAEVARGLRRGAAHLRQRRPALRALVMLTAHRLGYGVTTICTLLLYRNYFHDEGVFRAGLGGLAQVVAAVAVGGGIAALVTPAAVRRWGPVRWPAMLLALAAAVEIGLGLPFALPALLAAAVLLGLVGQGIKITVDTLVQRCVDDEYRGRVFALYDTMFNVTLVVAAVLTATVLPGSGRSPLAVCVIAAGYAVTALAYLRLGASGDDVRATPARPPATEPLPAV